MSLRTQFSLEVLLLAVAIAACPTAGILTAQEAQTTFKHLKPSAFPNLPIPFRKRLEARACTIPQEDYEGNQKASNVIHGDFAKKGQQDWAVLCLKDGQASIVLYWGGPASCFSELAFLPDDSDRNIGPITRKDIIGISVTGGGDGVHVPRGYPVLDHEGIEDSWLGKASEIHFCSKGKWFTLDGFD